MINKIMADEKNLTILQKQQNSKPEIDGFIDDYLDDNLKKTASGFVAWLRENKMTPKWGSSINTWTSVCKGKAICTIQINVWHTNGHHRGYYDDRPGSPPCLVITPRLNNMEASKETLMSEGLQDFIWDNANSCVYSERSPSFGLDKAPGCSPGKPCAPGKDVTVLGRVIKNNCCCFVLSLWNPDEALLSKIKRLLELEKRARENFSKKQLPES